MIENATDMMKESIIKRREKLVWKVYWSVTATVGFLIMLLPVNMVMSNDGGLAEWFIFYVIVAGATLASYGAILKSRIKGKDVPVKKMNFIRRNPSQIQGEVDGIKLPSEDMELLYSLRELEEWFRMSYVQNLRNPSLAKKEIEKWYRLGITKEILIRNLKRRIRELENELRSTKIEGEPLRKNPTSPETVQSEIVRIRV